MADQSPQNHEKPESNLPAPPPQDYYSVLTKVINDVTNDHTLLRKLVYALAWQNLKPEVIVARPIPEAQSQAKTISELAQALEFEKAIERVEAEAIGHAPKQISRPRAFDEPERAQPAPLPKPVPAPAPVDDFNPAALAILLSEPVAAKAAETPPPVREPEAVVQAIREADTAFELPQGTGVIVSLPDPHPRPERKDVVTLERIPPWLDPSVRVSIDSVEYAPIQRPYQGSRANLASFAQLIAASVIGVVLYIGISGWVYLGRHPATAPGGIASAPPPPPPPPAQQQQQAGANQPGHQPGHQQAASQRQQASMPPQEPQPVLPFPLPRTYGVYAGVPGKLFELQALPIKVPDPRVQASAEITRPSPAPIPGENLTFVVFRRDLVNAAPQTVAVRVVARVERATRFVNGKPAIVPLEGIWRVRAKSYEFRVSPLEGHNEMVVIQPNPGFVFPPGRYALVLNGFGYDFAVAGDVTGPEHCLEQVEVVNGAVLAECPKA